MDESILLYDWDNQEYIASDTDAVEIDYQKLEDSYYNALKRYELEKSFQESLSKGNNVEDTDLVDFSSDTDATLYTVGVDAVPTTCAQQSTAFLLDIRNILLIFLLTYFCLTIYSKLKTTLINYTK